MTGKMLSNGTDMWGKATHAYQQQDVKGKSALLRLFPGLQCSRCGNNARNLTGAPCLLSKFVCCVKLWLSITLSVARRARAWLVCVLRQESVTHKI